VPQVVNEALDGLTLDALYALTGEPPEVPNWIGRSAARLQAVSREEPYRVRLAQVPATAIRAQLATTALDRQYRVHGVGPEIVPPRSSGEVTVG
jgi:hypothetical protein